ncbi:helix-turn-helix domain-containing protein [Billgrantia bachuensis]|uniref:Transposase n=1 Tax=Billgrantia bachuensis TaxID=2717286 RepID=A0ABX0PRJ6_9GAMM|nr:helix-turn-helix domain-containing protein [Halomonas bachuensis]NIC05835.1 transposase [Halomonas bachuensis]
MAKYSAEFKLEVVLHHERQRDGAKRTAAHFGLDHGTVRMWVAAYRQHGYDGLIQRKRRRHYDVAFKLEVLRFLDQGGSIREACARFNIPGRFTIPAWQRRYASGGADEKH